MHKIRLTRKRVEIKKHSYVVTHKTHTFNSAAYTFLWCSLKETSCSCHFMSLQSKVVVFFFYSNLHWFVDLLFLLRLWQLTPPHTHTHTPWLPDGLSNSQIESIALLPSTLQLVLYCVLYLFSCLPFISTVLLFLLYSCTVGVKHPQLRCSCKMTIKGYSIRSDSSLIIWLDYRRSAAGGSEQLSKPTLIINHHSFISMLNAGIYSFHPDNVWEPQHATGEALQNIKIDSNINLISYFNTWLLLPFTIIHYLTSHNNWSLVHCVIVAFRHMLLTELHVHFWNLIN